tara:strand:- start:2004 stop:2540 length:537 start_codon:yes stop_codon:yes gene_type:complete
MNNRKCNIDGCEMEANYKAPSSPDELEKYIWFCFKHIKEYNKKWNFFANMTADEIEEFLENDIIGHRKTKKMGAHNKYFEDVSKISESIFSAFNGLDKSSINPNLISSKYLNALAVIGIDDKDVTLDKIKAKFKKIVKELHPDTVGENKNNTEKLTKVLEAYKTLKEYHDNFKYSRSI